MLTPEAGSATRTTGTQDERTGRRRIEEAKPEPQESGQREKDGNCREKQLAVSEGIEIQITQSRFELGHGCDEEALQRLYAGDPTRGGCRT